MSLKFKWLDGECRVEDGDKWIAHLKHESEIPTYWSEPERKRCTDFIRQHREMGEDEHYGPDGYVRFEMRDGEAHALLDYGALSLRFPPWHSGTILREYQETSAKLAAFHERETCKEWTVERRPECVFLKRGVSLGPYCYQGGDWRGWPIPAPIREKAEKLWAEMQLKENEVRSSFDGGVYELRWHNGERQYKCPHDCEWRAHTRFSFDHDQERAEAWFAANKPLADNEVLVEGDVYTLRWASAVRQIKYRDKNDEWSEWAPAEGVYEWKTRAEAWFAANKPLADNEVRFDCGTVGVMSIKYEIVSIATPKGECLVTKIDSGELGYWDWGSGERRRQITDETQRQRVRDFAAKAQCGEDEWIAPNGEKWAFAFIGEKPMMQWAKNENSWIEPSNDASKAALAAWVEKQNAKWSIGFWDGVSLWMSLIGVRSYAIKHERDLATIPSLPPDIAAKAAKEIRKHRPLEGDEIIVQPYKVRVTFEVEGE